MVSHEDLDNEQEEKLKFYIQLWEDARKEGGSCDLDNLPTDVNPPDIETVQKLVLLNAKIPEPRKKDVRYNGILTLLEPLFKYSKSLYYAALQAYLLELSSNDSNASIFQELAFLKIAIDDSHNIDLSTLATRQDVFWPQFKMTEDMMVEDVRNQLSAILSEEKIIKFFPSLVTSGNAKQSNNLSFSPENNATLLPAIAASENFKKKFNEVIVRIKGVSNNFLPVSFEEVDNLENLKKDYESQPTTALRKAVVTWFGQAYQGMHNNTQVKKACSNAAEREATDFITVRIFAFYEDSSHDSEKRFINELARLNVSEIFGGVFLDDIDIIKGGSQNFKSLPEALYGFISVEPNKHYNIPSKKSYPNADSDLLHMLGLVAWFDVAYKDKNSVSSIKDRIEYYLKNGGDFPALDFSQMNRPDSLNRLKEKLEPLYLASKKRNNEAILFGEKSSDFQQYSAAMCSVFPENSPPNLENYSKDFSRINNKAILTCLIFCNSVDQSRVEKEQIDLLKIIFDSLVNQDVANIALTQQKKDECFAIIHLLADFLPDRVREVFTSIVKSLPLSVSVENNPDKATSDPASLSPQRGTIQHEISAQPKKLVSALPSPSPLWWNLEELKTSVSILIGDKARGFDEAEKIIKALAKEMEDSGPKEGEVLQQLTRIYCVLSVVSKYEKLSKNDVSEIDRLFAFLKRPDSNNIPILELENAKLVDAANQLCADSAELRVVHDRFSEVRNSLDAGDDQTKSLCDILRKGNQQVANDFYRLLQKDKSAPLDLFTDLKSALLKFSGHYRILPDSSLADDKHALPAGMEKIVQEIVKAEKNESDSDIASVLDLAKKVAAQKITLSSRFFRPLRDAETLKAYQCINDYFNDKNGKSIKNREGWRRFIQDLSDCAPKPVSPASNHANCSSN